MINVILFHMISKLSESGFCVVAIVSDMGGGNQGLWGSYGISTDKSHFSV